MSEEMQTIETPTPARTTETVALEIRTLQRQAQGIVLSYAIEIGRRLEEAKSMLPHGEWGAWLKKELDYSQSTAQNFMRVFREYGDSQQSLFGGVPKSQAIGNLSYSKALRLLAIPDEEDRERFMEEHDVASMSTRELTEAIKARNEAEEKAAAAEDEARRLRQEAERLQEQLTGQAQAYEAKLTSADVETTEAKIKAREALEALERAKINSKHLQDALSEANTSAQAAEEEHRRLFDELEELRNRPTDVAVEVDEKAVEAARKAAVAEMTDKVDKADEKRKAAEEKRRAAEEALEAAQKELAELKAKGPEVRELTQEEKNALTAEAVERIKAESAERMQALEKQLSKADPDTTTLMVLFKGWQETYAKMWETLHRIDASDGDKGQKLRGGIRKALETALEQL